MCPNELFFIDAVNFVILGLKDDFICLNWLNFSLSSCFELLSPNIFEWVPISIMLTPFSTSLLVLNKSIKLFCTDYLPLKLKLDFFRSYYETNNLESPLISHLLLILVVL